MATRSKPQTSFYLNYGAVTPTNTADSLTPVFIAPRYVVHAGAYDNADTSVIYSGAAIANVPYPSTYLESTGLTSGAVIDSSADHVKVFITDPFVELGAKADNSTRVACELDANDPTSKTLIFSTGAVTANTNTVFFNNYQLQDGDVLVNSNGTARAVDSCTIGSGADIVNVVHLTGSMSVSGGVFVHTSNFVAGGVALNSTGYTPSSDGVAISSGATWEFKTGVNIPVVSGGVQINYRELLNDPQEVNQVIAASDAGEIIAATDAGVADWVGALDPENPLGMCYNAGIQTGYNNFYLVATAGESDADYNAALDAAGKVEAAYALFPWKQNALIIKHAKSIVAHYSAHNIAQMKRLWVYSQIEKGTMSRAQFVAAIADEAKSYNNHRINYIYAGPNKVAGEDFKNAQAIVPVLMAMRGAMAPHAPLTDVPIPGVTFGVDEIGLTDSDYDKLNNAGVWIVYRDSRGESVSRHAVTTGGDGTIAEEDSAVSNGDNILRVVRNQISFLRGNCNVTAALIDKIYTNVMHALDSILRRNYDALIGPQIIAIESVDIQQDPNNTAGVIGTINLDLPDVYLDGQFTFNLF